MSLANRLKSAQANPSNRGCKSCQWWDTISTESKRLINEWLDSGHSRAQLYEILSQPSDDGDQPLPVSETGWRFHLKHHDERCR